MVIPEERTWIEFEVNLIKEILAFWKNETILLGKRTIIIVLIIVLIIIISSSSSNSISEQ